MRLQKRLAAELLKCSVKRIVFDNSRIEEIKEAITKEDIRNLIKAKAITCKSAKGISRARARKRAKQRRKGRQRGEGKRKGTRRKQGKKKRWQEHIRIQRKFLKELKQKGKISKEKYRMFYKKAKGGAFRSKRHLKLLIGEQK